MITRENKVNMESFQMHLIFFGVLCVYQVFALPAQTAAGPALADAKVQDWSRLAPAAGQALSRAEMRIGNSIISKLDGILKDPTDTRPGKKRCLNHMDLELIIDSSGSIGRSEFNKGIRAMKTLVDYVDYRCSISRYGSQVGLIEFSSPSQTHVEFSMGDYTSRWSVNNAIDRVGYDSGYSTATANALRLAKTEFNQNDIPSNAKVAWILTDGNSNSGGNPRFVANELRRMGVMVCAVAIGGSINMGEINDIASNGCVFTASSFTRYEKIMEFAAAKGRAADSQSGQQSPSLDPGFFNGIQF